MMLEGYLVPVHFFIEQLDLPWNKDGGESQKRYSTNKQCLNLNIFEGLNNSNIITLVTQTKKNIEKDCEGFKTVLRGVETRISEKILITMYESMRTDDESTDGYYILQWRSESYTLQEDKEMEGYTPTIAAYTGEIVYDAVFLNHVLNANYWYTLMKTGVGDVTVRFEQVLLPNIKMIKIDKITTLPKRCKKKEATKLGAIRMSNEDIDELL